jgi:hypothetical protein
MKKLLLTISITFIFSTGIKAQIPTKFGSFKQYITKSNDTLKVGDKITFGLPTNGNQYIYITQGNVPAAAKINGDTVTIHKLKSIGNKTKGYKMYALIKGYGLLPVFVDIEAAIKTEEIEL